MIETKIVGCYRGIWRQRLRRWRCDGYFVDASNTQTTSRNALKMDILVFRRWEPGFDACEGSVTDFSVISLLFL